MSALAVVQQQRAVSQPDYTEKEVIETIKETVAKGATNAQLALFLEVCKSTGLNPFLKEIWFVPGVGVMAGRDGYLRVANEHPMFDGIETRVERDAQQIPIKAVCTVWRKDRSRPTIMEAYYNEYKKSSGVWNTYKSAMIGKVAEVLALKRAFSINGVVSEEEIGEQQADPRGTVEAARDVAKRKIDDKKAKLELELGIQFTETTVDVTGAVNTAPLAICGPNMDEERTELTNSIRQLLNSMAPAYDAADPASMAAYKKEVGAVQSEAFGVPSWKAITNLPLEGMRAGLSFLKAKANTTPEDSLEAIWTDKISMRKAFGVEKDRLIELVGEEQGQREYYTILEKHGAEKSTSFDKDLKAAMRCYVELRAHKPARIEPPIE